MNSRDVVRVLGINPNHLGFFIKKKVLRPNRVNGALVFNPNEINRVLESGVCSSCPLCTKPMVKGSGEKIKHGHGYIGMELHKSCKTIVERRIGSIVISKPPPKELMPDMPIDERPDVTEEELELAEELLTDYYNTGGMSERVPYPQH